MVAVATGAAPVGIDINVAAGALLKVSLDPATNSARLLSDTGAAAAAVAAINSPNPPPPATTGTPVYKKWWLWTAVGVVAAGAITAGVIVGTRPPDVAAPPSDYGPFPVFK